ncbi:MAG: hypothetical protein QOH12_2416 [Solirubrobacteraceae bacterium]|nr:hypothetical protein [Solirubrobacteraceae bacterium]
MAPGEFLTELSSGALEGPATGDGSIVLSGIAKPADGNDQVILFAHGTSCADWVEVPLSQIERVEVVRTVRCRDHSHPLVKLHLKAPQSEEGVLFAALARTPAGAEVGGRRRTVRRQRATPFRSGWNGGPAGIIAPAKGMTGGCAEVSDYEIDASGQIYCLDWCWEHDGYTESSFYQC